MNCLLLLFLLIFSAKHCVNPVDVSSGNPLKVAHYLDAGNIKEAQEKAKVIPDINGMKSYSGFFTVNKECGNNLFFWFLPAEQNWEKAPVLLWLSGGPGMSSLDSMFMAVGPFNYFKKLGFVNNTYHWTKDNNVIFLDLPFGTGFSFSDKGCFADSLPVLAQDVYSALLQFFSLFPGLQKNKCFILGRSLAAFYIPAVVREIDQRNSKASVKINLKGFLISSPYVDKRCHEDGSYIYQQGTIEEKLRDTIIMNEEQLVEVIDIVSQSSAYEYESIINYEEYINARLPSLYNSLHYRENSTEFTLYLRGYNVREQIHVGDTPYNGENKNMYDRLFHVFYMASKKYIQEILKNNKYIKGFYADVQDTSLSCVLRQFEWSGAAEYRAANRTQWYVDGRLAGWFQVSGNLFTVAFEDNGYFETSGQTGLELVTAMVADNPGSKMLSKLKIKP